LLQDSFDGHAAILARDARTGDPAAQGRRDPPATATPGRAPTSGAAAARIAEVVGRDAWKAETGDHCRALAAPAMLRQETPIGPRLRARRFYRPKVEAAVALRRIDLCTAPAMPGSIRIA
jgi:hypothetical protein